MGKPAPSANDLLELFKAEVQALRPDLAFLDGDVSEAMGYGATAMADAILGWAAVQVRNLFFGGATGSDLDTIILDRFGLARESATRAYGVLTFSRTGDDPGNAGTIPSGTQVATAATSDGTRVVVTTDTDLSIQTGTGTWTVNATAVDYGAGGNVIAGSLRLIVDSILSGDDTLTVDNVADFAGGNDSQNDADYAAAARRSWQTQYRGTLDALESGALSVASVRVAIATEDLLTGIATMAISDADGNSNGRMIYDVQKELESWRAAGSVITYVGGVRADLALTVSIDEYERGFDVAAATETIQDSIASRVNQLRVGQNLTRDSLKAAIMQPFGTSITKVSLPLITLTVSGTQSVVYEPDDIVAGSSLIRLEAAPTVIDGAA